LDINPDLTNFALKQREHWQPRHPWFRLDAIAVQSYDGNPDAGCWKSL